MPPRLWVRPASLRDLDVLVRQRRRMWEDMGVLEGLDEADRVYRAWARRRLGRTLFAWVAEARDGRVVGGGCLWLMVVHPRPGFPGGPQPYLLSFYTEPAFRGQGIARRIVRACVRWARERGHPRVTLHASSMGRPVYEALGFVPTGEMKLGLPPRRPRRKRPSRPGSASPRK